HRVTAGPDPEGPAAPAGGNGAGVPRLDEEAVRALSGRKGSGPREDSPVLTGPRYGKRRPGLDPPPGSGGRLAGRSAKSGGRKSPNLPRFPVFSPPRWDSGRIASREKKRTRRQRIPAPLDFLSEH